ncbi:MAG TPA: hypothetical protein VFE99_02120 [Agromyces sp.]|nr:hypothetical protein [Agromyces sp.]
MSLQASGPRGPQFRRPIRSARAAGDVRESHGGRRLATGITIAAGIIVVAHLAHALAIAPTFPPGPGPWTAWLALAAVVAIGALSRIVSRKLPDWLYVFLLVGLAAPVWLDVSATAGLLHLGVTPTAAAAAAAVLMPVAAIRGARVSLAIAIVIGVILAVAAVLQFETAGRNTVTGLAVAASAIFPVVLIALAIRGFRRLAGRELDLSLVQSTVSTPRSAVGMRASEELAQLDFDAETLLEDVGSGRIAIPLPAEVAERAGSLAARLRVRLIEGRNDTWLRHAVTESAYLSHRVAVDDPAGLAGLLSQEQRDGLLFALWLLSGARQKSASAPLAIQVTCRESDEGEDGDGDGQSFMLSIHVESVARRHVDPATWDAVGSVGTHDVIVGTDSLHIDIDCRVDPTITANAPAARAAARPRGS